MPVVRKTPEAEPDSSTRPKTQRRAWPWIAGIMLGLFAWQYWAKVVGETYWAPAVFLMAIATIIQSVARIAGEAFAVCSSYLHILKDFLKLDMLAGAFADLVEPIFIVLATPLEFFRGYFNAARAYDTPALIALGSIAAGATMIYAASRIEIVCILFWTCLLWLCSIGTTSSGKNFMGWTAIGLAVLAFGWHCAGGFV